MEKIKIVSWDVYGTLIATHYDESTDYENIPLKPRPGALEILAKIKSRGIIQCTCSDGDTEKIKNNLKEAGICWTKFFSNLYKMEPFLQKNFSHIIEQYAINPNELLVIGDNYDIDISLAKKQGCQTLHSPGIKEHGKNPLDIEKIIKLL